MRKRALGLSVLIVLLTALSARAESEFGEDVGGYLALSGMYVHDTSNDELEGLAGDSGGVMGRLGYRIGPIAAIEIQGDWNKALAHENDAGGFTLTTNFRLYPLTRVIDGRVGSSWLERRLQPYVMGGIGIVTARVEHQRGGSFRFDRVLSGGYRVGGGVDLYLTGRMALSGGVEWVDGMGRLNNVSYLSAALGVQYNF